MRQKPRDGITGDTPRVADVVSRIPLFSNDQVSIALQIARTVCSIPGIFPQSRTDKIKLGRDNSTPPWARITYDKTEIGMDDARIDANKKYYRIAITHRSFPKRTDNSIDSQAEFIRVAEQLFGHLGLVGMPVNKGVFLLLETSAPQNSRDFQTVYRRIWEEAQSRGLDKRKLVQI